MAVEDYKGLYVIAEQFEGKLVNVTLELLGEAKNWLKPQVMKLVLS